MKSHKNFRSLRYENRELPETKIERGQPVNEATRRRGREKYVFPLMGRGRAVHVHEDSKGLLPRSDRTRYANEPATRCNLSAAPFIDVTHENAARVFRDTRTTTGIGRGIAYPMNTMLVPRSPLGYRFDQGSQFESSKFPPPE